MINRIFFLDPFPQPSNKLWIVFFKKRFFLIVCFIGLTSHHPVKWNRYHITGKAQGTTYSIVYYGKDSTVTQKMIDQKLIQLDSSLSLYKSYSKINQFNNAVKGIILDEHLLTVIKKSLLVYKDTDGLFDVTIYPLVEAWGFGTKKTNSVPDSSTLLSLRNCVNSKLIELKENYLSKKNPCVKLDLDGIAQGYSVDILADLLEKHNINDYVVELGGEIRVKGQKQPSGDRMRIGIESPVENEFDQQPFNEIITIEKGAITTSGSYRKFHESNGKNITHIINPKTGYPQNNELISVTVYAEDAITADAYDNAFMLMGLEKALDFVEKRKNIAAYFIYKNNSGTISSKASSAFLKLKND